MALTALQKNQLSQAYLEDAQVRGLDPNGIIRELLTFLLAPRQQQVNQLLALANRRKNAVETLQVSFEANKAAELAALTTLEQSFETLITSIPGIDS